MTTTMIALRSPYKAQTMIKLLFTGEVEDRKELIYSSFLKIRGSSAGIVGKNRKGTRLFKHWMF